MGFAQSALEWVLSALATWGYLIVFIVCIGENLFIVGSFTPGDTVTAAAAFTATTAQGHSLSPWLVFAAAVLGTFIGTNISYFIGRRGGRELLERVGPRFGVGLETIEAAEEYFYKHGSATIILARYVAFMKNIAPAVAGASKMNLFWYEVYSFVGAVLYAGVLVLIGLFLGVNFQKGLQYLGAFSWVFFALVVIAVAVLWTLNRRRAKRRIAEEAAQFEAEHGGPEASEDADDDQD